MATLTSTAFQAAKVTEAVPDGLVPDEGVPWQWYVHAPYLRECGVCDAGMDPLPLMHPQKHVKGVDACIDEQIVPFVVALTKKKIVVDPAGCDAGNPHLDAPLRPAPTFTNETPEQVEYRERVQAMLKCQDTIMRRARIVLTNPRDATTAINLFTKWAEAADLSRQADALTDSWAANKDRTPGTPMDTEYAICAAWTETGTVAISWWPSWTAIMTSGMPHEFARLAPSPGNSWPGG